MTLKLTTDQILQQAITAHQNGKLEEAEALYREVLKTQPTNIIANNNLGVLLQGFNNPDEAISLYKKAIELKPDYADAHNNLGNILQQLNRFDEAETSCKKAIELKPDYAEAYCNLGKTLQQLNRFDEAEKNCKKAIELKPDYAEAHYNLGDILSEINETKESIVYLSKAIELNPEYQEAFLARGQIFQDKGEFELALKDFDSSKSYESSRAYGLVSLYNLGRIEEIYQRIEKPNFDLNNSNMYIAAFSAFILKKEKKVTAHKFCNNPMDFIKVSNLSSYLKDSNLFIKEVINELKDIETVWQPPFVSTHSSTYNGFQSKIDIFKNPSIKLQNLKSIIMDEMDSYYLKFKDEDCTFIKKLPSKKYMSGWHVFLKKQGYQDAHIHQSSWLSGVIYLKVVPTLDKNEGAVEFTLNGKNYSNPNLPTKIYAPSVGDMIFFPSSLHHRTIPFTTDEDRIVIAFDLL